MAWPRWTEFRNAEGSPWYSIGAGDILVLRFALGVLAGDPQHFCGWQAGTASVAPSNWDAMPSQSRSVLSLGKSFRLRRCYVTSELSLAAPRAFSAGLRWNGRRVRPLRRSTKSTALPNVLAPDRGRGKSNDELSGLITRTDRDTREAYFTGA